MNELRKIREALLKEEKTDMNIKKLKAIDTQIARKSSEAKSLPVKKSVKKPVEVIEEKKSDEKKGRKGRH